MLNFNCLKRISEYLYASWFGLNVVQIKFYVQLCIIDITSAGFAISVLRSSFAGNWLGIICSFY